MTKPSIPSLQRGVHRSVKNPHVLFEFELKHRKIYSLKHVFDSFSDLFIIGALTESALKTVESVVCLMVLFFDHGSEGLVGVLLFVQISDDLPYELLIIHPSDVVELRLLFVHLSVDFEFGLLFGIHVFGGAAFGLLLFHVLSGAALGLLLLVFHAFGGIAFG